jgi:hypothetical protein
MSQIQVCLRPFLEFNKDKRFLQCQKNPVTRKKAVKQSQEPHLGGEPTDLVLPLCQHQSHSLQVCIPSLGSVFLFWKRMPLGCTPKLSLKESVVKKIGTV